MQTERIVFLKELFKTDSDFLFQNSAQITGSDQSPTRDLPDKSIRYIQDIPDYLLGTVGNLKANHRFLKVRTLNGYCLDLNSYNNFGDYLNTQFGAKSRSNLRRYTRRLEECFPIRYQFYFQSISKQEYLRLFSYLRTFLIRRFEEKEEHNYELEHLLEYQEYFESLIQSGRAYFFVIYNDDKPISIRLNAIHNNTTFYIISGYDIDYSKFQLGNLDMMKNIQWCFKNNIARYDLLKAYGYYKRKWVGEVYYYYDYLLYSKKSLLPPIRTLYLYLNTLLRYRLLELIKKTGFIIPIKGLKRWLYRRQNKSNNINYSWTDNISGFQKREQIDVDKEPYSKSLKRPVYEFLFINRESVSNIDIFLSASDPNSYLIVGKNISKILNISHSEGT